MVQAALRRPDTACLYCRMVFRSSLHEAVAAYYQSRLEGDTLGPDPMLDVFRDARRGAERVKYFNGDREDSLLAKARQLIRVFHEQVEPDVTVLGVEEFFDVQLAKEVPPFHGYIDLIEQDHDGRVTVADLKTASKKPAGNAVHSNLQCTSYSPGAVALGVEPDQLTDRYA
jgi:putative RecB family exonuclease